jgi:MraZ protein
VFLGTFEPKLDEKGRIILPAKFWDELAAGVVVTRGQERCVNIYSQRDFEELNSKLRTASSTDKRVRDYSRMLLSGASQEVPDKQRRVTIPQVLRTYAGLDRELTVIGAGNHAEIWDTEAWNAYYNGAEEDFSNMSEEVVPGLF